MPLGTALHQRTFQLCESLNYREWSGYYAVSSYEMDHEHEYNAIRNSAALLDITPLFKYLVTGHDATKLVNRVITRDISKVTPGQVVYACWCDEQGKVIDDGTITRLAEDRYRWTAADPNLRWFRRSAAGMDVTIEDVSEQVAALALQGPTSGRLLQKIADGDVANLRYFRMTRSVIAGVPADISRTGYTGDLGYEIWMSSDDAVKVWDRIIEAGGEFDLRPAGLLALDVARIEAGLILTDVDYVSSRKALIEAQKSSPYEIGLGRLVKLEKQHFVGRAALIAEQQRRPARRLAGLEIDWTEVENLYDRIGLAPQVPSTASRVHVPLYSGHTGNMQVGKVTSATWSPTLKKMIALASITAEFAAVGTPLKMEFTVEAVRHRVTATVVPLPFFNPARKTGTPAA